MADPIVSVILPSYNRASFLREAFASIRAQTLANWELIVVDDGSTDDTRDVVSGLSAESSHSVRYHHQANQGPAGARNTGVDLARSRLVAFFDSDDLWLPHHLAECVAALEANPTVDWVYGACQLVDLESGRELEPSSFHPEGRRHPFLNLSSHPAGRLHVLTDPKATECMIAHGLMCGLQCSVMRRRIFEAVRLPPQRIAEDQIFVVQVLKAGFRLGYFDNVHTVYRMHNDSSSARYAKGAVQKAVAGIQELVHAYEALPKQVALSPREARALRRRLADEWFWTLGYSLLWQHGRRAKAFEAFRQGLRYRPWNVRLWKTYALAVARRALGGFRDAVAWRRQYIRLQLWRGVVRRLPRYASVFATWRDGLEYTRTMLSLRPAQPERLVRPRLLDGHGVRCRPGTSDPWVLWDVFSSQFQDLPPEVTEPRCIVDLGANVGYTAAYFAAKYPTTRILAVEMDRENYHLACQNLAAYGDRCRVVHAAVWDREGEIRYSGEEEQGYRVATTAAPESDTRRVRCRSLDSLFLEHGLGAVDFVKMDIEGAEQQVLNGPRGWLDRVRSLKIEVHAPATAEECSARLGSAGFAVRPDTQHDHCLIAVRRGLAVVSA